MPQLIYNKCFDKASMPLTYSDLMQKMIEADDPLSAVIIVPTGKMMRKLKKHFIREYFKQKRKPAPDLNLFTLQGFVQFLYYKLFRENVGRIISEAYRLTLYEEASEIAGMSFFKHKDKKISHSVLTRLAEIISGLKEDGILPQDMEKEIVKATAFPEASDLTDIKRHNDIYLLYKAYNSLLSDKVLDETDVLTSVTKFIRESIKVPQSQATLFASDTKIDEFCADGIFPKDSIMIFQGFTDFKKPETDFISLFAYSNLPVAMHLDFNEINGPLFGNMQDTSQLLTAAGFNSATIFEPAFDSSVKNDPVRDVDLPRSSYLRRWLFNTEKDVENPNFDSVIKVLATESIIDEVKSIAKLVKHLNLRQGVAPSDICIVSRHPNQYSGLFREVFMANDIPINISDRPPLSVSPMISAIFSIFDTVIYGYRREDVNKILSSPYLKFEYKQDDEKIKIDGANLYSAAIKAKISGGVRRGGSKAWLTQLEYQVKSLQYKFDTPGSFDDPMQERSAQRRLDVFRRALNDFSALLHIINLPNKSYTCPELHDIINNDIIEKLGIKQVVVGFYQEIKERSANLPTVERISLLEEAEKDARALQAFIDITEELLTITNERRNGEPIKLVEFVEKLKIAVEAQKYQIREKIGVGVNITSIEQTRGLPFKVGILCGALDGSFPTAYRTETFLGKELPESEARHIESEKIQFYQFLTNNAEMLDNGTIQLYITYPAFSNKEELVPSQFLNSLFKITTLNIGERYVYNLKNLRKATANPELATEDELTKLGELPWLNTVTDKMEHLLIKSINPDIHFPDDDEEDSLGNHIKLIKSEYNKIEHNYNMDFTALQQKAAQQLASMETKPYSISEIEKYKGCPQKYFLESMLRLSTPEEDEVGLSAMDRGNIFHTVLYKFYTELSKEQAKPGEALTLVRINKDERARYLELLIKMAKETLDDYAFDHPLFEIERKAILGSLAYTEPALNHKKGTLETWLDNELEMQEAYNWCYYPVLFEYSFGMKSFDSKHTEKPIEFPNKLKIKGKIDRIELSENMGEFVIADYKSKLKKSFDQANIVKGNSFQMPIYMLAARQVLANILKENISPAGAVYYGIKPDLSLKDFYFAMPVLFKKGNLKVNQKLLKKAFEDVDVYLDVSFDDLLKMPYEDLQEIIKVKGLTQELALAQSLALAKNITLDIADGKFPTAEKPESCRYCDFQLLCRRPND